MMKSMSTTWTPAKHQAVWRCCRGFAIAALALLTVTLTAGNTRAAVPGDLDLSFDLNGFAVTKISEAVQGRAAAMAVQVDGKVVVAGSADAATGQFEVARYKTDGSLDASFGDHGKVTTTVGVGYDDAYGVAIQGDGKIVVVGSASTGARYVFAIVRYNTDGSLDTTGFGGGTGKVTTAVGVSEAQANAVAIQSDGKIVAVGSTFDGAKTVFAMARYNADGSLDTAGFGGGTGKVTTAVGVGWESYAYAVAIQGDGMIVVAGRGGTDFGRGFAIARYNMDGSLDTTGFGGGSGQVVTDIGPDIADARGVAIQGDGKIVAAGWGTNGGSAPHVFAAARYNTDGSLDTTGFGGGTGTVTTEIGFESYEAYAVAIQGDGKIVLGGLEKYGNAVAVVRYNADGSLDTASFGGGTGNVVTSAIGGDTAVAVAIDGNAKIVLAARAYSADGYVFGVARYNTDGSLDATFDGDGIAPFTTTDDEAYAVAAQSDGKIVAAGYTQDASGDIAVAVMRYNGDGSLDPSFDGDGKVVTAVGGSTLSEAAAVAVQSDGKIVVAGDRMNELGNFDFALVRYNTDGSLDESFDGDGMPITPIGTGHDYASAVAIDGNGKIVAVGSSYNSASGNFDVAVVRYNANGTLDGSFGTGGKQTAWVGAVNSSDEHGWAVAIDGNDKIVVAGEMDSGSITRIVMMRFNTDGSFDSSFDTDGRLTTAIGGTSDFASSVAIGANDKIVVAGGSNNGTNNDVAVVRYNADGSLDTTFDFDGKVTTATGTDWDVASSVALQSDGKILVAGWTSNATDQDFVVLRYKTGGALDFSFSGDGKAISDLGADDAAYAVAVQPDGKIVLAGSYDSGSFAVARYFVTNCGDGIVDPGESCDDGNNVNGDGCDAGCVWESDCPQYARPALSCLAAPKTQLQIKKSADPSKSQIKWMWGAGDAFDQAALGAPDATTTYTLCIYDSKASVPTLVGWLDIPTGSLWTTKNPKGWNYSDKNGASDGVQKLQLKTGDAGKTKVQVKGGKASLPLPAAFSGTNYFAQDPSVLVQLINSNGMCLTSEFSATNTSANDGAQFKAKTQ